MKKCISIIVLSLLIFTYSVVPVSAAWSQEQKTLGTDTTDGDNFGWSVDVDGDYFIAGAPGDDPANSGAAYIFKVSGGTWSQEAKLQPQTDGNEFFGQDVAISGDYAIGGAYGNDDNETDEGAVFLYKRSGTSWNLKNTFHPTGAPTTGDQLGEKVAIDGNYAIAGADGDDAGGAAYIYVTADGGETWSEQQKLTGTGRFGSDVDIKGDYAVIGAPNDAGGGKAYVYSRSGAAWSLEDTINAPGGAAHARFGGAVVMEGDYVMVGDIWDDNTQTNEGSVEVFKTTDGFDTWTHQVRITNPDPGTGYEFFGDELDMDGTNLIISARDDDEAASAAGAAYLYTGSDATWTQDTKFMPADLEAGDQFSFNATAVDGDWAIVGSYRDNDGGQSNAGAVYLFGPPAAGGSVPEFSDYVYVLTILIAVGLMIKIVPRISTPARPA